jgi:uncharacterized membrane protein YeaQ/YmgE (transglycosylase-associated protein family)
MINLVKLIEKRNNDCMDIIYWTLMIGFITGATTRYFFRKMRLGEMSTAMIIGLSGSVIGGWAGSAIGFYKYGDLNGLIPSAAFSVVFVAIYILYRKKKVPKL